MELFKPKRLADLFSALPPVNLDDLLKRTIDYGRQKIVCEAGFAFVVQGATGKLELVAGSQKTDAHLLIAPNEGIVGRAFAEHRMLCDSDWRFGLNHVCASQFPFRQIRAIVALPVSEFGTPVAVFCFPFRAAEHGCNDPRSAVALGSEEWETTQELWEELKTHEFGVLLNRFRMDQIRRDLCTAGNGPVTLRETLQRYIIDFRSEFENAGRPRPDLFYVQLVDPIEKSVRTVQGFGMPLSFGFMHAHAIEGNDIQYDIQSDIVRNPHVEMIVGKDSKRFDDAIYEKYGHHRYTRLWIPLLPFPSLEGSTGPYRTTEEALNALLTWKDEEESEDGLMRHVVAEWSEADKPQSNLVFGTLEIGYLRQDINSLTLAPWNKELALWCIARSFELSQSLFWATLQGSLERIGQLLASAIYPATLHFSFNLSLDPGSRETRKYPFHGPWPAAFPVTKENAQEPFLPQDPPLWRFEHVPITIEIPFNAEMKGDRSLACISDHVNRLIEENAYLAGGAAEVALRLHKTVQTVLKAQELHVLKKDDSSLIGTLRQDRVVASVCEEAARVSGAKSCHCIYFEENPISGQNGMGNELWWIGPPASWSGDSLGERALWPIRERARLVARTQRSEHFGPSSFPGYQGPMSFLPLELTDSTTAVLVLRFSPGPDIPKLKQLDLEGRVPGWVYRISMRRLHLRNRFSKLMMNLLRDIAEAQAHAKNNLSQRSYVSSFVEDVLRRIVRRQKCYLGIITLYSKPTSGPNRVERFFCCQEDQSGASNNVEVYGFVDRIPVGPCSVAICQQSLVIFSDRTKSPELQNLINEMEAEATDRKATAERERQRSNRLRQFASILRGDIGDQSTVVTIPVLKMGEEGENKAALTLVLVGQHYFDRIHQNLILEFGEHLADALDYSRNLDQQRTEKKYQHRLEVLRRDLEQKETVDDLVGALLRRLAFSKPGDDLRNGGQVERFDIADDIVVWNLPPRGSELVVRSIKGNGFKALSQSSGCQVINPRDHPLVKRGNISLPRKAVAHLNEGLFRFLTIPLARAKGGKDSNDLSIRYAENTDRQWLISFPIVDAMNRVFGVVDCLRDEPIPVNEEKVLETLLRRLSVQFCSAVERCHFERAKKITEQLFSRAEQRLRLFRTGDVYCELVEGLKEAFNCRHCDLFLEHHGSMVLHTTTRGDGPASEEERFAYNIKPTRPDGELMGYSLNNGKLKIQHAWPRMIPMDHFSSKLKEIMYESVDSERMAIPLKAWMDGKELVVGILHLQDPQPLRKKSNSKVPTEWELKKSRYFTGESIRIGQQVGVQVQRIVQMAQIVENQGWLVNELAHSMGQPLQRLRYAAERSLLLLHRANVKGEPLGQIRDDIYQCFAFVHEAKEQLGFLTRLSHPDEKYVFEETDLKMMIEECCTFVSAVSGQKMVKIFYGGVRRIDPVPLAKAWIRKAFLNLLDNACKYSWDEMDIRVRAEEYQGKIEIVVSNLGVGIPSQNSDRIFEPFFRFRVPDKRGQRPGTGFGLSIVKHAVEEIHKGKIDFKSEPFKRVSTGPTSVEDIIDVLHKTTFRIELDRSTLTSLSERLSTESSFNGR